MLVLLLLILILTLGILISVGSSDHSQRSFLFSEISLLRIPNAKVTKLIRLLCWLLPLLPHLILVAHEFEKLSVRLATSQAILEWGIQRTHGSLGAESFVISPGTLRG